MVEQAASPLRHPLIVLRDFALAGRTDSILNIYDGASDPDYERIERIVLQSSHFWVWCVYFQKSSEVVAAWLQRAAIVPPDGVGL